MAGEERDVAQRQKEIYKIGVGSSDNSLKFMTTSDNSLKMMENTPFCPYTVPTSQTHKATQGY